MVRKVQGVGINDADYSVVKHEIVGNRKWRIVWRCPFYTKWAEMMRRCYSANRSESYRDASVCESWWYFSNFRSWMESQEWVGKELDKDLIIRGNKVYGPETCIFIEKDVNSFITEAKNKNGDLPVGVSFENYTGRYKAVIADKNKQITIGRYDTPEEAHQAWLTCKRKLAKILAEQQDDPRVAEALIKRYENYSEENKQ